MISIVHVTEIDSGSPVVKKILMTLEVYRDSLTNVSTDYDILYYCNE